MATFNAIWSWKGFTSIDLDFLASKKIFNIYMQVSSFHPRVSTYPKNGGTSQLTDLVYDWTTIPSVVQNVDFIHSYDPRFKVLSWTGPRFPADEYEADIDDFHYMYIMTAEQRNNIINQEIQHVQDCHFDGVAQDLETGNVGYMVIPANVCSRYQYKDRASCLANGGTWAATGSPRAGVEVVYNRSQEIIDFWNAEAAAMHNLGKISAPFAYAGQGLWMGNFDNWKQYFSQLVVDYAVITLDNGGTEHTNPANNQIGYIETLKAWLDFCPSKLAPTGGYGGLPKDIAWTNDYVAQYGNTPKLAGRSMYDYAPGRPGTPPSNQIYPHPDSPITDADWALWDAWALKNLDLLTFDFNFSKAYQGGIVNLALT